MEDCTYYNNTSSYDHDDLVLSSSESTLSCFNASRNATQDSTEDEFVLTVVVGIVLGLVWIATMTGNVGVLAAIWMEKNLHSLQNYLIFSLAVADLMVACLVMPLAAVYEVSKVWSLGEWLCITWTSSDVLSCTASILHLVAIAMDRYWAVTNIDYIHRRNSRRVLTMIFTVWMLALVISLTQLGWKDETWKSRIEGKECTVNQDKYFQIFATLSSFYVPLAVILFLYWKIFQAARKRIRKRRPPPATSLLPRPAAETSLITTASSSNPSPEKTVLINNYGGVRDTGGGGGGDDAASTCTSGVGSSETTRKGTLHHQLLPPGSPGNSSTGITPETTPARKITKTVKETGEAKRERKAAKTLGIITDFRFPEVRNCFRKSRFGLVGSRNALKVVYILVFISHMAIVSLSSTFGIIWPRFLLLELIIHISIGLIVYVTAINLAGAFIVCWLPFFVMALTLAICGPQCDISRYYIALIQWLGYSNSMLNPVIYTIFSPEFRLAFKKILFGKQTRKSNRAVAV